MSKADDTALIWEPYEAEILSLYVDQSQSLEKTMAYMKDKYGLRATEKQYKTKFSGYKNMRAPEWTSVGQEMRKRALDGKDSDLYLCGRRLDPKRVRREIARHQSKIPDEDSTTVIGTSSEDRIYIRTPPPPALSPCPLQASVAQHVSLDICNDFFLDMTVGTDMDFSDPASQIYQSSLSNLTEMNPLLERIITENTSPQHDSIFRAPSFSENFDLDMFYYINVNLGLLKNLPWFQLQTLMEEPGFISISSVVNEIFQTPPQLSGPFSSLYVNQTSLALDERHSLLSGFLTSGPKELVGDYIPHFTINLQKLVPERQEGELSMKVQQLFDPSNKYPLDQLFELAMYFSSNNMLTDHQTDVFLKWVIDQKHTDLLKSFLQIKTPTVQAFTTRVLESGIRIKDIQFLQLLIISGFKFDGVLEQAIQIKNLPFLKLLLRSVVDSSLLSGTSGGRLLRKVAMTSFTEIAHILLQNGADVNFPLDESETETPLICAAAYSNVDMVKCLLNAGALVNVRIRCSPPLVLPAAVLRGTSDIIAALLERGANVNHCYIDGKTMLEWSALNARDTYQVLREAGKGGRRLTAGDILYAAEAGTQAFAKFLCDHEGGVSQNQLEEALKESLNFSKLRATLVLLGNGVDPNGPTLDEDDCPLRIAASLDGVNYSQLLINAGASVDFPGLLATAVKRDNFELLTLLIDTGADLEKYGPEALEAAGAYDRIEMAALLFDRGIAVNAFGNALTGFQAAAHAGNIEFAQYLIERGADVNAPASEVGGRTALQAAAEGGTVEMVAFLLDEHADVNAPPAQAEGLTALEAALSGRKSKDKGAKIFKILLDNGALINHPSSQSYKSAKLLHDLIKQDHVDLIRLALEAGINVNCKSSGKEGKTPLQLAAGKGDLSIVKLLLEYGAEINAPPGYKYGRTALQAATSCETPDMELVQFLVDNHATINATAGVSGGITALQGAAIRGHIKIALLLLERGADVNARAAIKDGRSAIEGAAEHGRLDMVQLLLNAGAKGDVTRKTGFKRAIEFAEKNRHFAIAQVLRDQDANEGEFSVN